MKNEEWRVKNYHPDGFILPLGGVREGLLVLKIVFLVIYNGSKLYVR